MDNKLERLLSRIFHPKEEDLSLPTHDSHTFDDPVSYEGDSLLVNPAKLPIGGRGYPIRWRGKPARILVDEDGSFSIYNDPN